MSACSLISMQPWGLSGKVLEQASSREISGVFSKNTVTDPDGMGFFRWGEDESPQGAGAARLGSQNLGIRGLKSVCDGGG